MSRTLYLVAVVIFWFGFNFARAESETGIKIVNPATEAVQELTEANIEAALAEREKTAAPAPAASAAETEIPVVLESRKGSASEGSPLVKMILGLLVVSGLALAAWFGVRRYRFKNHGAPSPTEVKVLSQFHLGPKKSLAVVRVAGESILIGVTDHHISLIKSLALLDEELPEDVPKNFGRELGRTMKSAPSGATEEGDDFAISGIRDFVSGRLKNMRSFE